MARRINKVKSIAEAEIEIDYLYGEINNLRSVINNLNSLVEKLKKKLGGVRLGKVLVTEGTNEIRFDTALSSANWVASEMILTVNDTTTGKVTINERRKEGFKCWCFPAGTLEYLVWE